MKLKLLLNCVFVAIVKILPLACLLAGCATGRDVMDVRVPSVPDNPPQERR